MTSTLDEVHALINEGVIVVHGRYFVSCDATVPVHVPSSPVKVRVWAELTEVQFGAYVGFTGGKRTNFEAFASLACDWPGFAGSVGSPILVAAGGDDPRPRIKHIADLRVQEVGRRGQLCHDEYAALYRKSFGGPSEVVGADGALREAIIAALHGWVDSPVFVKPVEPPARFAGIEPAAVVLSPPADTGAQALLGTVGISEAMPGDGVELMVWARDPTDEFQRAVGDFCYWSRQSKQPLREGTVVTESLVVPSTNDMTAWLVCEPWWLEHPLPAAYGSGKRVDFLSAVPISRNEQRFAERRGTRELADLLERRDVDISDLRRDSAVS